MRLFYDLIYHDFLNLFKILLRFKKSQCIKGSYCSNYCFPFYRFDDQEYQIFIVRMLSMLEVRKFKRNAVLYDELDEVTEAFFVIEGNFAVGYDINQKKYLKYKYFPPFIIGGFNLISHSRS